MRRISTLLRLLTAVLGAFVFAGAHAADAQPAVSPEGLKLVPSAKVQVLYLRDGADFSGYDKFAMLECYVAFVKNWKKVENDESPFRVHDDDMVRIKADLAKEFQTVFVRELTAKGESQVTAVGKGVLILRPSLVNLDVVAPDTMNSPMNTSAESAGQATLLLEVFDSISSQLLARIIDTQSAGVSTFRIDHNGQTNRADAEKLLTKWAVVLADSLAQARSGAVSRR
jgi:hypothetical protein